MGKFSKALKCFFFFLQKEIEKEEEEAEKGQ